MRLWERLTDDQRDFAQKRDLAVPVKVQPHIETVDAHIHLDTIMQQSPHVGISSLLEDRVLSVNDVVCCLAFPQRWGTWEVLRFVPGVVFTVSFHPHVASEPIPNSLWERLREMIQFKECVGVGEMGLDFLTHTTLWAQANQMNQFKTLLELAVANKKTIVLHLRPTAASQMEDLDHEAIEIMKPRVPKGHTIYLHCFTGGLARAQRWNFTFSNMFFGLGKKCLGPEVEPEVVANLHLGQILLESDAPYLMNSSMGLTPVIKQLARARNLAPMMIGDKCQANAGRCFQW